MILRKLAGSVASGGPNNTAKMIPRDIFMKLVGETNANSWEYPVRYQVSKFGGQTLHPHWLGRITLHSDYTWFFTELHFQHKLLWSWNITKVKWETSLFIHTHKEGKDLIKFLFHKSSLNSSIFSGCSMNYIHKINILLIVSNKCRAHCQWSGFGLWVFLYEKLPIFFFHFAWVLLWFLLKLSGKIQENMRHSSWSIALLTTSAVCKKCSTKLALCKKCSTNRRW